MNLCSEGHEEICYESRYCPACEILKDRDYFDAEVGRLEQELAEARQEITDLYKQLDR